MKRYVCTVAAGMLLALASAGTAAAGLPLLSSTQSGSQVVEFGQQTVGKQSNDADVTQAQGNGNVNVSPAISVFGDASTSNSQGDGDVAIADVDQSNSATQTQSADQQQTFTQDGSSGACCDGSSQTGDQSVYGGDQKVGKQKNDADVDQYQGNGNVNIAPAISVFGDASTRNSQGNGNVAVAKVDQSNTASQSQSASQQQAFTQGAGCCPTADGYAKDGWSGNKDRCCDGQSQTGEQQTSFGDQKVGKQENDADVDQYQGNDNVNASPAISLFSFGKHDSCSKECGGYAKDGGASTWNSQGNGNVAFAGVDQSNDATQSQSAWQGQSLVQGCCAAPTDP